MNNQGRNGQTYNTNQIEVISSISNGEEQTNHSSSTSSLDQRNNIYQGNTILVPQVRRGFFYLGSLPNYHEESTLGSTSTSIQVVGNDEQRFHLLSMHDPELRRALLETETETIMDRVRIGLLLRLQLQRRHRQLETSLTEDEIMKHISCENFKDTVEGTSKDKELCCICQEAYVNGEEIGKLDCTHFFHVNCIKQWLAVNNICPLCKRKGIICC